MKYIFQALTVIFFMALTFFTGQILDKSSIGWKAGIAIIIIEWFIFLHIYYSIWPEALN